MIKFSHSKLDTILKCPMTYYLNYIEGISLKIKKSALSVGEAVHWGIEHNNYDLSDYYKEKGNFKQKDNYNNEQVLAESMVYGYIKNKDELFSKILSNYKTDEKLKLLDESHELYLTGKLKSNLEEVEYHEFVGIIDLLLLTDKGFIIIDYKTSSIEPDWDKYLDQIYRYIMLLKCNFPDTPIYKIGIINLRKTRIKQKQNENDIQFLNRVKLEYELNDEKYINYHEYPIEDIDKNLVNNYINNLSKMCDAGYIIDKNKNWYINFNETNNIYGKCDYYDIFYHTPDNYLLYKIKDEIWDDNEKTFINTRDCIPLDMEVIDYNNCLNKFSIFEEEYHNSKNINFSDFIDNLKFKYRTDDNLLKIYTNTLKYKLSEKN